MRERPFSSAASEKLSYLRVTGKGVGACAAGWKRQAAGSEGDAIRMKEPSQDLDRGTSFDGMRGVVVRDRRGRHQRGPCRVGGRVGIPVGVGFPDRGHRPPVVVEVLGLEGADVAVGEGHVEQAEQPRLLPRIEP